jgi:hypothetical protein|tara:strand:+ start:20629 stop:20991 length:363 start_codon:yes stop_codon:yes gene_type:complete
MPLDLPSPCVRKAARAMLYQCDMSTGAVEALHEGLNCVKTVRDLLYVCNMRNSLLPVGMKSEDLSEDMQTLLMEADGRILKLVKVDFSESFSPDEWRNLRDKLAPGTEPFRFVTEKVASL